MSECVVCGIVLCVWVSWVSECAAGGFCVVCVGRFGGECVVGGFVLCVCVTVPWSECGAGGFVLSVWDIC